MDEDKRAKTLYEGNEHMRKIFIVVAGAVLTAAVGASWAAEDQKVQVELINGQRQPVGEATLTETPSGVLMRVQLRQNAPGIKPGAHAIHLHEVGECDPPFKSAGGHFNPSKKKHGFLSKEGRHAGDLPNIYVPDKARATFEFLLPDVKLGPGEGTLRDNNGSALVIHESADDYRTDPAGDSGDRVACGVIAAKGAAK
jgi:Cu-Zn family superoxide dismutase